MHMPACPQEPYIHKWQSYMVGYWDGTYNSEVEYVLQEVVGTKNVTKEDVLYACALVGGGAGVRACRG